MEHACLQTISKLIDINRRLMIRELPPNRAERAPVVAPQAMGDGFENEIFTIAPPHLFSHPRSVVRLTRDPWLILCICRSGAKVSGACLECRHGRVTKTTFYENLQLFYVKAKITNSRHRLFIIFSNSRVYFFLNWAISHLMKKSENN